MSMHKGLLGQSHGGSSVTPGFDRIPVVHMPANVPQSDITLGDYITRAQRQEAFNAVATEHKMSFNTWWELNKDNLKMQYDDFAFCWDAAQENK